MKTNLSNTVVYLVDDEFSVRDSMTVLLESTDRVIKSFASAQAFLNAYDSEKPGCLILDIRMPDMDGLELQQALLKRDINIPIIFISGNADIPDSAKAFRAGALDFLEKPFDNQVLLERIDEAIKKDIDTRNNLAKKQHIQQRLESLTPRETEVLQLIVNSHSNKEAAKLLHISHRTIEAHRNKVMEKMQAQDITALVNMLSKYDMFNEGSAD